MTAHLIQRLICIIVGHSKKCDIRKEMGVTFYEFSCFRCSWKSVMW